MRGIAAQPPGEGGLTAAGLDRGLTGHRLGNLFLFVIPQSKGGEQALKRNQYEGKDFHKG